MLQMAAQLCLDVYGDKQKEATVRVSKKNAIVDIKCIDDTTYVAFRGSDDFSDWYSNIKFFRQMLTSSTSVHLGFYTEEQNIRESVMKELRPTNNYVICGHSLGGAIAIMFAKSLYEMHVNQVYVYTFGCPNIGNDTFCRDMGSILITNVMSSNDVVCRFPFSFQKPGKFEILESLNPWYWFMTNHSMQSYHDIVFSRKSKIGVVPIGATP